MVALAALGVVYGDIGTSPLYALRSCFAGGWRGTDHDNVWASLADLLGYSLCRQYSASCSARITGAKAASWRLWPWRFRNGEGNDAREMGADGVRLVRGRLAVWDCPSTLAIPVLGAVEGLEVASNARVRCLSST